MSKVWKWIFGILVALMLITLVLFGRSERQAYRAARGVIEKRTEFSQERIDLAVEMATKSVDMALMMAGNLPSQQAQADLIKQDIEEIGKRLKEVSETRGDLALTRLNTSIEVFNKTLEAVDSASQKAENPEVKAALDRLYGILISTKEQLVQTVLKVTE